MSQPSEWRVGSAPLYMVYRLKDEDRPDTPDNRQYVSVYFSYPDDAVAYAKLLNEGGMLS